MMKLLPTSKNVIMMKHALVGLLISFITLKVDVMINIMVICVVNVKEYQLNSEDQEDVRNAKAIFHIT